MVTVTGTAIGGSCVSEVHCHECGRTWPDGATYCGACGARLAGGGADPAPRDDHTTGSGGRPRWFVIAAVLVVVVAGAGAATLTPTSPPDEAAMADDEDVVVPDRDDLQDPDARQRDGGAPPVTCEREGEEVGCVSWIRRLDSASSAPDLHSWRFTIASDLMLAQGAQTIVAVSRSTGQVVWRNDVDVGAGPAGGPWALGDEVVAIQAQQEVRALSLTDGDVRWTVDGARLAFSHGDDPGGAIYTVQVEDGQQILAAHDGDGTERWRHAVAEPRATPRDRPQPWLPVEVTAVGPVVFVVRDGPTHALHTIALDREDGTEHWRRVDSRPLHASRDVAVMRDVDREVTEDGNSVTVSESPARVVGLDVTDGSERWRHEAGAYREFGLVGDVAVLRGDDGLTGVRLGTGEPLWHRETARDERLVSVIRGWGSTLGDLRRVVTFVPAERRVVARDPATGEVLWQTELEPLVGHVVAVDGAILGWVNDSTFVHLDPATGRVRGTITTEPEGRPWPLAHDVLAYPEAGWVVRVELPDA